MKNLVKILAVVVALSMVLGVVAFGATFSDVKDSDNYYEAVSILSSLGILSGYPDGTFGPEKSITRAEFAAVVDRAKALGDSAEAAKGATMFTDVAADNWASGYINLAAQQGIINGMGDGTFAPDSNVTFAQAVKMIVAALGYTPMATSMGGYPSGYLAVAAQKGVTKGVSATKENEPATRATVAKMVYNSLDIPLMEQTGFGTDIKFEAGDKILLDAMDIVKVEGVVTDTKYSGSNSTSSSIKPNEVKFTVKKQYKAYNGKLYTVAPDATGDVTYDLSDSVYTVDVGETNAASLLQYDTIAYIKNIDDTPVFKAIAPYGDKNKTLTIKSSDIRVDEGTLTSSSNENSAWDLCYYIDKENSKDDTVTIEGNATYYYNGSQRNNTRRNSSSEKSPFELLKSAIAQGTSDADKLEGTIVLLNNDTDDDYDVVFVTENKDYVVDEIYPKTYKISDTTLTGKSIIFDLENKDYDIHFVKDGKPAKFEDIQKDDVLSVCGYVDPTSKELEFGTVTIVSNKVEGKVSEFNGDDREVTIGDKTYEYVEGVDTSKLEAGDEGSYYLNADGKIIAVDSQKSITNTKLALFTKIGNSGSISSSVQARALLPTGEWKTFDFASKVTVNEADQSVDPQTVDWSAEPANGSGGAGGVLSGTDTWLVYKIASYDVNSDGKINKIDFKDDSSDTDSNFYSKPITNAIYDANNKKFSGSPYYLTDSTVIYNVPDKDIQTLTEDDISIVKADSLVDDENYGNISAYNYNSDNEVSVLLGSQFEGKIKYSDNFMVVDTVAAALDSNNDSVTKVTGYQGGEKVSIILNNDTEYEKVDLSTGAVSSVNSLSLVRGSVILYTKNVKDEADKVQLLFNAQDLKGDDNLELPYSFDNVTLFTKTTGSDDYRFILGYANSTYNSRYRFSTTPTTDIASDGEYQFATTASIVKYEPYYNTTGGRVSVGDSGDIDTDNDKDTNIDGDFVFARVDSSDRIVDALIIKHKSN